MQEASPTTDSTTRDRALLIEDNEVQAKMTTRMLESSGYSVAHAENGVAGLHAAATDAPDIIVTDVMMPKLNGYSVCRLLKDDAGTAHIPIVVLTALDQPVDRFWAEECGADRLVNKRVLRTDLIPIVRELLASRPSPAIAADTPTPLAADPESRSMELLDRILLEQTIVLRFRRIDPHGSTVESVLEELSGVVRNLVECHAVEFRIALPSGEVCRREPSPDGREATPVRGFLWSMDLEAEKQSLGSVRLRLYRDPDSRGLRLLNLIGFEITALAATLVHIDREAMLTQQIQQGMRLRSVGQLASQMAHEMNTPAQYSLDCVRFVADALQKLAPHLEGWRDLAKASGTLSTELSELDMAFLTTELPEAISDAEDGLMRIAKIVLAMRDLSPLADTEKRLVHLQETLEASILVSSARWSSSAEFRLDLEDPSPRVWVAPGDLQQLIVQLIDNSVEAIERCGEGKGVIEIQTRSTHEGVTFSIRDNGEGMTEEVQSRVFEPFFTTKTAGGMGHGLALVHAVVVDRCGGRVECQSIRGEGAAFTLWFPAGGGAKLHAAISEHTMVDGEEIDGRGKNQNVSEPPNETTNKFFLKATNIAHFPSWGDRGEGGNPPC